MGEVPGLSVRPATASFARLYRCRPTEDPARKDRDELNTDRETWNTEMKTEIFTARVVTLDIILTGIFRSPVIIIEILVTNFYNLDNCVNFYFISLSIYILYKTFVNKNHKIK